MPTINQRSDYLLAVDKYNSSNNFFTLKKAQTLACDRYMQRLNPTENPAGRMSHAQINH
jgi:hypothetical protein